MTDETGSTPGTSGAVRACLEGDWGVAWSDGAGAVTSTRHHCLADVKHRLALAGLGPTRHGSLIATDPDHHTPASAVVFPPIGHPAGRVDLAAIAALGR